MENKNLPEDRRNDPENESADKGLFDENFSFDGPETESPEEELDISELLRKYLPDFADSSANAADADAEPESVDPVIPVYSEETAEEIAPDGVDAQELPEVDVPSNDDAAEYSDADVPADDPVLAEDYKDADIDSGYTFDEGEAAEDIADAADPDDYDEYSYAGDDNMPEYDDAAEYSDEEYAEADDVMPDEYQTDDADAADTAVAEADDAEAEAEEIAKNSDLDATDINLMVAFGLDDELAKTMGPKVAAKLAEEIDAEAKDREEQLKKSVENEYVDPYQTPTFAAEFRKRQSHLKVKLALSAVLAVILLIYENLKVFGIQFSGALDPMISPVVYIMVSLQIMLFAAAPAYEQLLGGIRDMFTGRINPRSAAAVGNVFAIVYSVVQAESSVVSVEPVLFNSCAAFMSVAALVYDLMINKRDILSFNIVSSKRPKYAVTCVSAEESGIPAELFPDEEVVGGGILQIEKTKFVDKFFARTTFSTKSSRNFSAAYIFIAVIAAAVMGVFVALKGDGSVAPLSAAAVTFFAAAPLSIFVAMSYPLYKGASDAYDLDGAILGDASAEEYSEAGTICFNDTDAFPSYGVKVQNIKIYNNHRIDRVLYYAASAFKKAGGPLSDVFEVATMEIGISDDVAINAAAKGYLSTQVDGKSIIFGRADVLRENGINLPDSVTEEDLYLSSELCPMYMIREGRLMAKLLIRYMLDSDFEFLLKDLSDEGMCACIKTFDPNIDDDLINEKLGGKGEYPFRVIRYVSADEIGRINDRVSSGIISRGTTKTLLGLISSCTRILDVRRTGFVVGTVSAVIAIIVVWLMLTAGSFGALSSLAIVAYQLLWAGIVCLLTRLFMK